jgi:Nif-specific regulatory protein
MARGIDFSGRYDRIRLLGEGGAGRVWLVRDHSRGGRLLALKELTRTGAVQESALRAEFATLRTLRHPNLVEVHEFEIQAETGLPQFTLEFIEGDDIVSAVRKSGAEQFLVLAAESLRALSFLHDFGLIHRDLKPANLLVRNEASGGSRLVVLDFGLATHSREAATHQLAGTLAYMAPELLKGGAPGPKSDLYSLGAVLFEAALGRPLIEHDPNDSADVVRQVTTRSSVIPRLPQSFPKGANEWLAAILSVDPSDRPATASEALASLNSYCEQDFEIETRATRAARLGSGPPPGRESVIEKLWGKLVPGSDPRLVLLVGEAGSGKSRVLRWISAEGVRRGWEVSTDSVPRVREQADSGLGKIGTESSAGGEQAPRLVLIDDPDSAGPHVIEFLGHVAAGSVPSDTLVVATLRPSEIGSNRLRRIFTDSEWNPRVDRVDLNPMDSDAIEKAVARVGHHESVPSAHVKWLEKASEGNALLLESLLVERAWQNPDRQTRHPTLEQSVASRLDRMTPDARRWLEALAVLGRGIEDRMVAKLCGQDSAAADRSFEEAVLFGLATRIGPRCSPASEVIAGHVLAGIDPERSESLHRRAAEHLEREEPADTSGRLARLWRGGRDTERSVEQAVRVARLRIQGRDWEGAADWFRFAVEQISSADPNWKELNVDLAEAAAASGHYDVATRAMATGLRQSSDGVERAELLVRQSYYLLRAGEFESAMHVAEEAAQLAERAGRRDVRARARNRQGMAMVSSLRNEEALQLFRESAEEALASDDASLRAESLHMASVCASNLRQLEVARELSEQASSSVQETSDHVLALQVLIGRGIIERRARNHETALEYYSRARTFVGAHGLEARLPQVLTSTSIVAMELGRYDEALRLVDEAIERAIRSADPNALFLASVHRGGILLAVGRPTEAIRVIDEAMRRLGRYGEANLSTYAKITLAEAYGELRRPDFDQMRSLLEAAAEGTLSDPKLRVSVSLVELERRVLEGVDDSFGNAHARFLDATRQLGSAEEPMLSSRAEIAHAQALHQLGNASESETVARSTAVQAREKDLPECEARAWAVASEAQRALGRSAEADRTHRKAREALDRAAQRIRDEEMRQGFLDRPVFRSIRKPPEDPRSSGEQRLLAIYDMLRVLNSETDPDVLLETMLDMALDVVQAERGLILLRDGDGDGADYSVRLARDLEKQTIDDAAEFSRNVVLRAGSGKAVLAIDTGEDERLKDLKSVSMFGIRSVLCVPLRSRDRIVGAVYLDNRKEGALFSPDDLRFLEAFADHAALALENARVRKELEVENRRLRVAADERVSFDNIIGRSGPMQAIYDMIEKTATSHLPVLIQGESGTGKELVARAIHAHSLRKRKPFLVENCAAIPETLLESELFGHVRGAFTGADRDHSGLFEQAHGGTLFLDEIGDMPASMQARLLRVLQEGELRRVGAERVVHVDVRLVTATHRDLPSEVAAGRFREDLLYRLQVLVVQLPALRDRPGDVPLLVDHFLRRISRERGTETPSIRSNVMALLESYAWPGNVRQLENHIQRIALLAGDGPITLAVIEQDKGLRETLLGKKIEGTPVFSLEHSEKEQIRQALEASKGNRTKAARLLGISRATIFRKIKEYGLV